MAQSPTLVLRSVLYEDWHLLITWRNDPETVENSIHEFPILLAEHKAWLAQKLSDPQCIMLIGEVEGAPIGQVRFDCDGTTAEVSVVVGPKFRGKGYGTLLLAKACNVSGQWDYVAYIKPGNHASFAAFEKAGFSKTRQTVVQGVCVERLDRPGNDMQDLSSKSA